MSNISKTCNSQLATRNYPRGNIILMVLFILVTSSAFALLMMQYTRTMFDQTMTTASYNRAYYLANAGLEVGLADSLGRVWYQKDFADSDGVLDCPDNICTVKWSIVARGTFHDNQGNKDTTECTKDNAFSLEKWDSLAFPLFWEDELWNTNNPIWSQTSFIIKAISSWPSHAGSVIKDEYHDSEGNKITDYPAKVIEIEDWSFKLNQISIKTRSWNKKPSWKQWEYLVLINKEHDIANFCVQSDNDIPRAILRVDGQGQFHDYNISLSATKKVSLPGFLFSTSVGRKSN